MSSKSEKQLKKCPVEVTEAVAASNGRSHTSVASPRKAHGQRLHTNGYDDRSQSIGAHSGGAESLNSYQSNTSMAKIKIRRAFDLNSNNSKKSKHTKGSTKSRNKRNTSVTSQLSQESLKKIHTFALKAKGTEKPKEEEGKPKTKVYYVEEHVKVLSEIIASADPILSELASQIH